MPQTVEAVEQVVVIKNPHRQSAEWGLGSLAMGVVVCIMTPVLLIVLFLGDFFAWNGAHMGDAEFDLAIAAGYAVAVGVVALAGLAILFGLVGLISALARSQSFGLSLSGTLLGIVAMVFAVVLFLSTGAIGKDLRDLQKLKRDHRPINQPFRP